MSLLHEVILLELIVNSLEVAGVSWKGPHQSTVGTGKYCRFKRNHSEFLLAFAASLAICFKCFYELSLHVLTLLAHLRGE